MILPVVDNVGSLQGEGEDRGKGAGQERLAVALSPKPCRVRLARNAWPTVMIVTNEDRLSGARTST